MTDADVRIAALLAIPDRAPDVAFANEAALRLTAERRLAARLAADRARTATLIVATASVAAGLWLFAQGPWFAAVPAGHGFAALAGVLALWFATAGAGALASD